MLDKYADKALQRSEKRAMYHIRTVLFAVGIDIGHIETLGKVKVELYGRALPFAAEHIFYLDINFRPIESAAALINLVFNAGAFNRLLEHPYGGLPHRVFTHRSFRRTGRQVYLEIVKPERTKHGETERKHAVDLIGHLIGTAEEVRIVLGKSAHPEQSVENPAALVPVYRAQFRPPERELAVRPPLVFIYHDMKRAVHRLRIVCLPVDIHG